MVQQHEAKLYILYINLQTNKTLSVIHNLQEAIVPERNDEKISKKIWKLRDICRNRKNNVTFIKLDFSSLFPSKHGSLPEARKLPLILILSIIRRRWFECRGNLSSHKLANIETAWEWWPCKEMLKNFLLISNHYRPIPI